MVYFLSWVGIMYSLCLLKYCLSLRAGGDMKVFIFHDNFIEKEF